MASVFNGMCRCLPDLAFSARMVSILASQLMSAHVIDSSSPLRMPVFMAVRTTGVR